MRNGEQARCALDVCGTSRVRMQRCSVRDTSAFSLRLYLRAHVEAERCHIAYSMSGILLQDRCSLDLSMSRVEKVWFGPGVSALGHSKMSMVRCDLRQCSFGLVLHESAAVDMSYSAVINCTYAAFHQMEQEDNENEARQGDRVLGNSCCLNLTGNSIYSSLSHMAWWDNARPRVLVQEKNLFEDDDQPAISVGLLSASIRERVRVNALSQPALQPQSSSPRPPVDLKYSQEVKFQHERRCGGNSEILFSCGGSRAMTAIALASGASLRWMQEQGEHNDNDPS